MSMDCESLRKRIVPLDCDFSEENCETSEITYSNILITPSGIGDTED